MAFTQPLFPSELSQPQYLRELPYTQGYQADFSQIIKTEFDEEDDNNEDFHTVVNVLEDITNYDNDVNELREIQLTVLTQIRDAVRGIVTQLVENSKPKTLVLRASKLTLRGKKRIPKAVVNTIRCLTSNLHPMAVKMRVLEIIFNMIITKTFATKRDIFYKNKQLFGTQVAVDKAITDICAFLNVSRTDLNILSASRGSLIGPMNIQTETGVVDCRQTPISIVQRFLDYSLTFEGNVVLLVEKDTIFQRLIEEGFCRHFPDILLVTGRGFPDFVTRQFIKKLETDFKVPIYALVDCDPHGLHIVLTYKYGSMKASNQMEGGNDSSTIQSVQQIGLRPSQLLKYHMKFQEMPFTHADNRTLNLVKKRAQELGDQALFREAKTLDERKVKVELEALVAYSPHFLITYLRDCREQMPWVLHHESVAKSTPWNEKTGSIVFNEID